MIKILHTADVHLGRAFPSLREKGPEHRRQLLATFSLAMDLAIRNGVSLVLIAGDLFDSNAALGAPVRTAQASFRKLDAAGIQVCILPGTHDRYDEDGIYRLVGFSPNVTVLTPEHPSQRYADLNLTVYGAVFDGRLDGMRALQGLSLSTDSEFHVGMAHGSLRMEGASERGTMVVDKADILGCRLDYLALGHWHSFRDCSQGGTKAFYCGSPEPIDMDQKGSGSVALVTIHGKGSVDVEPVRVGTKAFDEMVINVELMKSIEDIARVISAKADPNLILEVALEGVPNLDHEVTTRELEEGLGGLFFCLRVTDRTSERLDDVPTEEYPQNTVAGRFIRSMEARMAQCPASEKGIHAEALRLGFALIQKGPRVIE